MAMAGAHLVRHQALHTEFTGNAVLVQQEINNDAGGHEQMGQ